MPIERLSIQVRKVSFPANEMGRHFHVGITVNKTTQTVESAAAGGALQDSALQFPRLA
jgi:hypothetical protein